MSKVNKETAKFVVAFLVVGFAWLLLIWVWVVTLTDIEIPGNVPPRIPESIVDREDRVLFLIEQMRKKYCEPGILSDQSCAHLSTEMPIQPYEYMDMIERFSAAACIEVCKRYWRLYFDDIRPDVKWVKKEIRRFVISLRG